MATFYELLLTVSDLREYIELPENLVKSYTAGKLFLRSELRVKTRFFLFQVDAHRMNASQRFCLLRRVERGQIELNQCQALLLVRFSEK